VKVVKKSFTGIISPLTTSCGWENSQPLLKEQALAGFLKRPRLFSFSLTTLPRRKQDQDF